LVYQFCRKQIIKSMLRKVPEHRPTAAELLRHSHLQPFLLRCQNPSPTFLPVKSPSPKSGSKEKKTKPSPEAAKKDLLPLFDESKQFPNSLPETKRVDPTSYSGKVSTDSSDDSKSRDTGYETCTTAEETTASSAAATSDGRKVGQPCLRIEAEDLVALRQGEEEEINMRIEETAKLLGVGEEGDDNEEGKRGKPQRADALESLLELCAQLLKQHKLDELTGILKPFGDEDDTVSSRETAIWLTKTLINAKKIPK
ncbi:hypothetical protein M569_03902, partial [Genlisea aurea]